METRPSTIPHLAARKAYWVRTRRLTFVLLSIWFTVTFSVIFFARELSEISLFGWSFSYYMAAQGMLFIYVLLVGLYAWYMPRLDKMLKDASDNGK
jgi:putative solute:sodium symporter small subunit